MNDIISISVCFPSIPHSTRVHFHAYHSAPGLLDLDLVESSVGYPKWLSDVLVGLDMQVTFITMCGHLHSILLKEKSLSFFNGS